MRPLPVADLHLARRLERLEGLSCARFVESRARLEPSVSATWIEVAGVYAMFDGVGSPLTQCFGLGLFAPFGAGEFDQVESFFDARGASTAFETSEFAPEAVTRLLPARGYTPIERSVVLLRSTAVERHAAATDLTVRRIDPTEGDLWARVGAEGWSSEGEGLAEFVERIGSVSSRAEGAHCFLAERDGRPIAAAALNLHGDVALMAGASTIPSARRLGAQAALFEARLAFAAEAGCEFAMVVTQPESGSRRNAERRGFTMMYARTKWERPHPR